MSKLLQGNELLEHAKKLGVNTEGEPIYASISGRHPQADESEIQRRVIEAERHIRESRLWLFALLSALASVISAVAAWVAILK